MDSTSDCRVCGGPLSREQTRKHRPFCSQRCCGQHKAAMAKVRADAILAAGEKPCAKCGQTKRLDDFYEDRSKLDGRRNSCAACDLDYQKQPTVHERRRAWNHTDKAKQAQWRYYHEGNGRKTRPAYSMRPDRIEKTRESVRKSRQRWYQRVKDTPEYRARFQSAEFREKRRERENRWANRPEVKVWRGPLRVQKVARRRALKASLSATLTPQQWQYALAYFEWACVYCGAVTVLHQDHFIPLTSGGPYAASNIVPACRSCNASKGKRMPEDWCAPEVYAKIAAYFTSLVT